MELVRTEPVSVRIPDPDSNEGAMAGPSNRRPPPGLISPVAKRLKINIADPMTVVETVYNEEMGEEVPEPVDAPPHVHKRVWKNLVRTRGDYMVYEPAMIEPDGSVG